MPRTVRVLLGVIVLAVASSAAAQSTLTLDKTLPVQLFEPGIGPTPFFTVEGAEGLGKGLYGLSLTLNYQSKPFRIANVRGTTIGTDQWAVKSQLGADVVGAFGITDRIQLGVGLPVSLGMTGQPVATGVTGLPETSTLSGAGIGDLRAELKWQFWRKRTETQSFSLAAVPVLTVPLAASGYAASGAEASQRDFLGDRYPTFRPRVAAEFKQGPLHVGGNLGAILRARSQYLGEDLSHQLMYSAAIGYDIGRKVVVRPVIEISGRHGFNSYQDTSPLELSGGVKVIVQRMWEITVGGGGGLIGGIGAPQARGFIGVAFNPDFRDRDGDGIPDVFDECPDQPEDKDGFKDADGCPDPDNDGDGIPDEQDKCPNEPEDFDGFQDEDGCPDLDNDHDGIPDIRDACPFDAEDGLAPKPDDGCPVDKTDSDGDGIMDNVDKCPEEAEDKDGFQDEDGCPDPDNDGDGVPDSLDQCPDEPEDMDGFEDDDGCPDPDNDKDGVPDKDDKCPNEPETINGFQDDDGCPDKGEVKVVLNDKENKIEVKEGVNFRVRGDEVVVGVTSHSILSQLAQVLRGHSEIAKLKIIAHGGPNDSKALMARRASAVRLFLIGKGVGADRLQAALGGTGGSKQHLEFIIEARKVKGKKAVGDQPAEGEKPEGGEGGDTPPPPAEDATPSE
ncbi:MAG TPA: thrombospondin type 3 repeat-containing protein [Polyangia bacterium]|jgi:outer membrane protein OmpA-like peptidoglycan-associated protein